MSVKNEIYNRILQIAKELGIEVTAELKSKISITYPDSKLGDYATNAALILAKAAKKNPVDLARQLISKLGAPDLEKIEVAGPGFINFILDKKYLINYQATGNRQEGIKSEKILVEYFQPNIAKPLHIGHLRTAIIGDSIYRMLKFLGHQVESDTHMGDWGTQFGFLILAYKKYGTPQVEADPINELNKLYIKINEESEKDPAIREAAKLEFVKLEKGDNENRTVWKKFVEWSLEKHLQINSLMNIEPFDHHWPESFYEDKMPKIIFELQTKGLLKESQGAKIVNLESQGLGVALIVKSDGGTTYLLRDLATFVYRKSLGFSKQLYVVDVRQSHAFKQLFAILKLLGLMKDSEGIHIDYGFMSFKGEALSTRKGNMVLAEDVINQAKEKVGKIIKEKNPDLANNEDVITAIAQGAIKYFDLSHNRHSDIEFDWEKALDFEGNSGPYLQYTNARLLSILRKHEGTATAKDELAEISETERKLLFKVTILNEIVEESMKDYSPNVLANYLYELASLANRFYHESPILSEADENKKAFRLGLVNDITDVLSKGLELLGITPLDQM